MKKDIDNNMNFYCAYLRKSRKDLDAEAYGQGETLARHEKQLRNFASSKGIKISKFYREIVSGETISARPIMQQLLQDVENGMWAGVLVVEVERLARGNTLDQGIVSNAFQYSNTKIITPLKTYDPNNSDDEEYFEFGLFMSRREYKKINQRLHNGILASVNEGKFIAPQAPYGYKKYKLPKQKGYSLEIEPQEADMVRLIYNMYIDHLGIKSIAKKLKDLGYKPKKSSSFGLSTISNILSNPVYIGKIQYKVKNSNNNLIYVDGIHEPIIDIETWNKVQEIRNKHLICKTKIDYSLKNPMASILKCALCGKVLDRITYSNRTDVRVCCRSCKENVGSNIDLVESKLLEALNILLKDYKLQILNENSNNIDNLIKINETSIENNLDELEKAKKQLNKVYDMLELGIYSKETFIERSNLVKKHISEIQQIIKNLNIERNNILDSKKHKEIIIPRIENVISSYWEASNISMKNKLLKSVLEKVEYKKINPKSKEDFELVLYPKL